MLELLYRLFFGHYHIWEQIEEKNVFVNEASKMPHSKKYICRCKTCGRIRAFTVSGSDF